MFLTKEAIWKVSLELSEDDVELISEVNSLAEKFVKEGIDNRDLFISKTIDYTHSFFKLFEGIRPTNPILHERIGGICFA